MKDHMEMMSDAAILMAGNVNSRVGKISGALRDRKAVEEALQAAKGALYALSALLEAMELASVAQDG